MKKILLVWAVLFTLACESEKIIYKTVEPNETPRILTSVSSTQKGSACLNGGYSIKSGEDANKNGVLDIHEVTDIKNICVSSGLSLIKTEREPAGVNCSEGGVAIKNGLDSNENGILEEEETENVTYVCNGLSFPLETPSPSENRGKMFPVFDNSKPEGICSRDMVKIYNKGFGPLTVKVETGENTSLVRNKISDSDIATLQNPLTGYFYILPDSYITATFNFQPGNADGGISSYSLKSDNPEDAEFLKSASCSVSPGVITDFSDALPEDYFYISSEYDSKRYIRACVEGAECFIGVPYGVLAGLYPVTFKVDWGDGSEEESLRADRLSALDGPLLSHTYDISGDVTVIFSVKTLDMADFISSYETLSVMPKPSL